MNQKTFVQMVENIERGSLHRYATSMSKANAVKLLRAQHRQFIRLVETHQHEYEEAERRGVTPVLAQRYGAQACRKILTIMAAGQKGKR